MREQKLSGRYSEEFKADAVKLLISTGRSRRSVAEDLGISRWTLRDWYRAEMSKRRSPTRSAPKKALKPADETAEERLARLEHENADLRKENADLKMYREILKKAAAFFAKESE